MPPPVLDYWSKPNGYSDKSNNQDPKPATKAMKSTVDTHAAKKRKRSRREELDDELADLETSNLDQPTLTRRKNRISLREDSDVDMDDDLPDASSFVKPPRGALKKQIAALPPNLDEHFSFSAICTYKKTGVIDQFFQSEDLSDCDFLWERINKTKHIWDKNSHGSWSVTIKEAVYKSDYNAMKPPCITRKLSRKRTNWRKGYEGMFACRDCVKMGRPCFVWVPDGSTEDALWDKGELRILPLHHEDRTRPVVEGKTEVRYWVNDDREFQDNDVLKMEEDDDEYVD